LVGCHDWNSLTNPDTDKSTNNPEFTNDPGRGNLAGNITGTILKQPLAGVSVSVRSRSATTDVNGFFRLNDVGEGILVVRISGERIYPHTTIVRTTDTRYVQLDAIEKKSGFHLEFYRELARGNHPAEGNMFPIHRWTNSIAPTFYIDTNASATDDGVITQRTIDTTHHVITQVLPVFSGNTYSTALIHVREFSRHNFDAIPDNSIVISYDDTLYLRGGVGLTVTEPDFASMTASSMNKVWIFVLNREALYTASGISREEIVAHELGHGFGYRHTSLLPSVMKKIGPYGGLFSEYDKLHMAIMYNRPVGNTDIDNDPVPTAKLVGQFPERQIFIDGRGNFPQPAEVIQRLRSLQSLTHEFLP
jgi:hypothetical protein